MNYLGQGLTSTSSFGTRTPGFLIGIAKRYSRTHHALSQPPLVIGLLFSNTWLPSHHQDDSQRCACQVRRVALTPCQRPQCLSISYYDELPVLAVAGAARPARHIEHCIDHFRWYRIWAKLAHCAQAAQELYKLLRVFCLCHNSSPLYFP